jgi:hypothetical protein
MINIITIFKCRKNILLMRIFWKLKDFLMIICREQLKIDIHFNHKHIMKENGREIKEMEKEKWFG